MTNKDLYLIIRPSQPSGGLIQHGYGYAYVPSSVSDSMYCTDDLQTAHEALESGKRVFKLNALTELSKIDVSYTEVPMELA